MNPTLFDPALSLAADILSDLEKTRIAQQNRIGQLTRAEVDSDGLQRGFGLDPDHPDVIRLGLIVFRLEELEVEATKELERKLTKHPLADWVKAQKGVGKKQIARLLATIGDPYINGQTGKARTLSGLLAYSGYHTLPSSQGEDEAQLTDSAGDQPQFEQKAPPQPTAPGERVAARRRKGQRANWSTAAKTRTFLIAESCIKQLCASCKALRPVPNSEPLDQEMLRVHSDVDCTCSPFRVIYDKRRLHTAKTNPDWTDGHSHNDGLRITAKNILKELWKASRAWHKEHDEDFEDVGVNFEEKDSIEGFQIGTRTGANDNAKAQQSSSPVLRPVA